MLALGAAVLIAALAGVGMVVAWDSSPAPAAAAPPQVSAAPEPARFARREYPAPVAMPYLPPAVAPAPAVQPRATAPRGLTARYPQHSGR